MFGISIFDTQLWGRSILVYECHGQRVYIFMVKRLSSACQSIYSA